MSQSTRNAGLAPDLHTFGLKASTADVQGLVCCITGASAGLGQYVAQALFLGGAEKVYVLSRNVAKATEAAKALDDPQNRLKNVAMDVSSKSSIARAAEEISKAQGDRGIDLLICNAGISGKFMDHYGESGVNTEFTALQAGLDNFSEDEATYLFKVNALGPYFTSTAFLPVLKTGTEWHKAQATKQSQPWPAYQSQVIIVSSNAAVIKLPIINALYNMSKAAASHWGAMLSTMLTDSGVRCNIVEPGLYPSDMTAASSERNSVTGHRILDGTTNGADIPAGRAGWPHEHAASVLFLAGRSALFANGARLRVDGGAVQKVPSTD